MRAPAFAEQTPALSFLWGEGRPCLLALVSPHWSIFLAVFPSSFFPFAFFFGVKARQGGLALRVGRTALVDFFSSGLLFFSWVPPQSGTKGDRDEEQEQGDGLGPLDL
jgi:hypothetical protein